jgi:hypothetical protein
VATFQGHATAEEAEGKTILCLGSQSCVLLCGASQYACFIRYSSECSQSADGVPAAQRSIQPPVESGTCSCPFTYVLLFLFALEMSLVILNHAMISSFDCGSKVYTYLPRQKSAGCKLKK